MVDLLGPVETGRDQFDYEDFKRLAVLAKTSAGWIGSTLDPGADPPKGDARPSKLLPYLILGASLLTFAIVASLAAIRASGARSWLCWSGVLFAIVAGLALGVRQAAQVASSSWSVRSQRRLARSTRTASSGVASFLGITSRVSSTVA